MNEEVRKPFVLVTGSFDDLRSGQVRFLEEAAKLGSLHVLLFSDEIARAQEGKDPKFPLEERLYLLEANRFVDHVTVVDESASPDTLPIFDQAQPQVWVVDAAGDTHQKRSFCAAQGITYQVFPPAKLAGFPAEDLVSPVSGTSRKRVLVTGCYDWFHSGHVRFFEEASQLGDLYVVVGHDANVRLLKGEGHPLFGQDERRYMVQSVRYVKQALISSGNGWMDAEPEIALVRPHIYAVNEDGDKPEKRAFCEQQGLEYIVLKRKPREGLPKRESTVLRGF
jgi:cytidyltransferase-like protein